jgi:hypothetical protein
MALRRTDSPADWYWGGAQLSIAVDAMRRGPLRKIG